MTTWQQFIDEQKQQPYLSDTLAYVEQRRAAGVTVFPPAAEVFNAFELTPFAAVKVVILGQDPYHGPKQAHGLCFSVMTGIPPPPSLKNIYKALSHDFADFVVPQHGCLTAWAEQGVLLLNAVLTVEQGEPNSHQKLGWAQFTDRVIESLNQQRAGLIFLLWGSPAQKKGRFIDSTKHTVLKAPHPSPLSAYRGFFECGHFAQVNQILLEQDIQPIDWQI